MTVRFDDPASWRSLANPGADPLGAMPLAQGDLSGRRSSVLRRGDYPLYRLDRQHGERVLLVAPSLEAAAVAKRLEHEFALRSVLGADRAARPISLSRYDERPALVLEDPGGEPADLD